MRRVPKRVPRRTRGRKQSAALKSSGVQVGEHVKYRRVRSRRFFCRKCKRFLVEWVPVLRRGQAAEMFRRGQGFPETKLECPNCYVWSGIEDLKTSVDHPFVDLIEVNTGS